jgi:predicted molibdopterin-dependent oxidoreductase YjgC
MIRTPTICPFCGCGCSFYLVSEADRVVGIEPNASHPVNKGMLCAKGWNAYEFIHSPERLTVPLVRKQGRLVESSWDEALGIVAERLTEIKSQYGSRALAFLASAKVTNEENYLFMKMARAAFGTNNVDHCARL